MKVVVASHNQGKLKEIARILTPVGVEMVSMKEAIFDPDFELSEDGDSFEKNARQKAQLLHQRIGGFVLADDSGLEVDALAGAPGVFSARYAGSKDSGHERDRANIEKLLRELRNTPESERGARFVCVMLLLAPGGQELVARGTCAGQICSVAKGENGFGYDPVFVPQGFDKTMAELPLDQKNQISHRGKALLDLQHQLQEYPNFFGVNL